MRNRLALQNMIVLPAVLPAVIKDNAAFTGLVIDTAEMSYGEFHCLVGSIDANMSVFRVMASDIKTDATTLGGTPVELHDVVTKPTSSDSNKVWVLGVDFMSAPRPRYIKLEPTAGNGENGTYFAASFVASRDGKSSSLAADRGVAVTEYIGAD